MMKMLPEQRIWPANLRAYMMVLLLTVVVQVIQVDEMSSSLPTCASQDQDEPGGAAKFSALQ